ncbi:hypothetical protein BJX70DRAFT_144264 [Aspergillus crustosus]
MSSSSSNRAPTNTPPTPPPNPRPSYLTPRWFGDDEPYVDSDYEADSGPHIPYYKRDDYKYDPPQKKGENRPESKTEDRIREAPGPFLSPVLEEKKAEEEAEARMVPYAAGDGDESNSGGVTRDEIRKLREGFGAGIGIGIGFSYSGSPSASASGTSVSGSGSDNASTPRANTGGPTISPVGYNVIKKPPMLEKVQAYVASLEPVEHLLSDLTTNVTTQEMIDTLAGAEVALARNDADEAEEKTRIALRKAEKLGDQVYIERCEIFLDWVQEMRDGTLGVKKIKRRKRERKMEGRSAGRKQQPRRGSEVDAAFHDDDSSRNSSPGAEVQVLGDMLEGEFYEAPDEEGWADSESAGEGRRISFISDFDDNAAGAGTANEYGHEGFENEHFQDFDPRSRPTTPIPSRSPTPDAHPPEQGQSILEDFEHPEEQDQSTLREYDQAHLEARSISSQTPEAWVPEHHIHPGQYSNYESGFVYTDSEDTSDADADAGFSDSKCECDTETALPDLTISKTRKRSLSPISNTAYRYTHIQKHKRCPDFMPISRRGRKKLREEAVLPLIPKPWHTPAAATDILCPAGHTSPADFHFHNIFYNAHLPAILLTQDADGGGLPEQTPTWLTKYDTSPFCFSRSLFTFREKLPMAEMSPRVRRTSIFSEQDWEYIPDVSQWETFQAEMEQAKVSVTMGFLEWERERIKGLVDEKNSRCFVGVSTDREKKGGMGGWENPGLSLEMRKGYKWARGVWNIAGVVSDMRKWAPVSEEAFFRWFLTTWVAVGLGLVVVFFVLLTVLFD